VRRFDPRIWAALSLVLVAALIGYGIGTHSRQTAHWHTGNGQSMPNQVTVQADGWAYAIPIDVAWDDDHGNFHDHGRPDCLPPNTSVANVRFKAIDVEPNGIHWRQVIFVTCQR
jgi:hypothetical protein